MKLYRKYSKTYWKPFSIAIVFLTFEALCDLLQPTILSNIIDNGVANKDMNYVMRYGGLMLFITLLGAVFASTRNIISSYVSQHFGMDLRADLFRKIQMLSFENIDEFDRASLITRVINDVTQVQVFVNGLMRIFVKAPLIGIGSLILAIRLNPQLAVVLAVIVPIVGLFIWLNMKIGFPFFLRVQQELDRVNRVVREYLSGIRVVKAFNRFDHEGDKFKTVNEEYQNRSIAALRVMAGFNPAIALTVNIGIVAVLWLGGLGVNHGQMQIGHVIAFINYITQILFSLMIISMVLTMFVRARASFGRINEVFLQENHMTWSDNSSQTQITGSIDFDDVCFSYKGAAGDPVVNHVTFHCVPGETVGIIGSTGSGKSSLISLIPRFYDVTSGSIKINGEDVRLIDPKILREKIAIVPQKNILFTGTIIDNIRWGKEDASREEIIMAARMAGAHDFIIACPEGYETKIGQGGVNLSGGQKQRLAIARALVRKPEILILDDCTSAVDVETEGRIKQALSSYATVTRLIIAQRMSSVMDADMILVFDHGEIVGMGKHEDLLKSCKLYQEIAQSQVGKVV
ncbi:ABC transporter ATP-binding protein [Ectobacillus sp. sgz5001026]|uniref:ABC transporter ATP-binding protein n=1 Tax=Ectobacillus sp. sgz5001026 TaxID=3242473 RepID=UPI0036D2A6ED